MFRIRQSHCNQNVTPPPLLAERVDVYICALSNAQDISSDWACLSPEEIAKAHRFHFEEDRIRYVRAHALLRRLLIAYLNEAEQLRFQIGPHGKPQLIHAVPIQFNLSHTHEYVVIAVGYEHEIGIDVERYRVDTPVLELAQRFFTSEEIAFLEAAHSGQQPEQFYWLWTRKEAVMKATGQGLMQGLDSFSVLTDQIQLLESWQIYSWKIEATVQATLCFSPNISEVHLLRLCG